jgi:AraC-like DNA-binding protein
MQKPWEMMRQLNQMNFSVLFTGHVKCSSDWRKKPYVHRFNSLWLIVRGRGTFILDGTSHTAEPGKLFIVSPGMVIERFTDPSDPLEFYFIRFSYAFVFEENEMWSFRESNADSFPLQGIHTLQNPPPIINAFDQMNQLMKRRGQVVLMRRRILFMDILIHIISDFRAQMAAGNTTMSIEKTIEYMVNHYYENLTLEELAKMAGLSSSHYSRLFKQYTNYSPIQYLMHLRMDRAKELLILSDYRLKAIAQSVGYDDELYFSRMFKKVVGISPSEYTKAHKTAPNQ